MTNKNIYVNASSISGLVGHSKFKTPFGCLLDMWISYDPYNAERAFNKTKDKMYVKGDVVTNSKLQMLNGIVGETRTVDSAEARQSITTDDKIYAFIRLLLRLLICMFYLNIFSLYMYLIDYSGYTEIATAIMLSLWSTGYMTDFFDISGYPSVPIAFLKMTKKLVTAPINNIVNRTTTVVSKFGVNSLKYLTNALSSENTASIDSSLISGSLVSQVHSRNSKMFYMNIKIPKFPEDGNKTWLVKVGGRIDGMCESTGEIIEAKTRIRQLPTDNFIYECDKIQSMVYMALVRNSTDIPSDRVRLVERFESESRDTIIEWDQKYYETMILLPIIKMTQILISAINGNQESALSIFNDWIHSGKPPPKNISLTGTKTPKCFARSESETESSESDTESSASMESSAGTASWSGSSSTSVDVNED